MPDFDVFRSKETDWVTSFAVHDPLSASLPLTEDQDIAPTSGLALQKLFPSNSKDLRFVLILADGVIDPSVTVLKVF